MAKAKIFLCLLAAIAATAFSFTSVTQAQEAKWIDSADTGWYTARSADVVFTIKTAEELAGLAKLVNEGTEKFAKKTVKLGSDIDLGGKVWTGIGIAGSTFCGLFDGQGYTVGGLGVITCGETNNGYFGLFGKLAPNPTLNIRNLNVTGNISISPEDIAAIGGNEYRIGAIAGDANGAPSASSIENCSFKGSVKGCGNGKIGGITGHGSIVLRNCSVEANITTDNSQNTTNTSTVAIGGVSGFAYVAIENCFFNGSISSSAKAGMGNVNAGGIAGDSNLGATITNCAASCDINIIGGRHPQAAFVDDKAVYANNAGGIAGVIHGQLISGCSVQGTIKAASMIPGDIYVTAGGIAGSNKDDVVLEHCSSTARLSASSDNEGSILGCFVKKNNVKMYQCEWLSGEGLPVRIASNDTAIPTYETTNPLRFSVTEATSAADLTPVTLITVPTVRILENKSYAQKASLFPSGAGKTNGLLWTWGSSDGAVASIASSMNEKAVVKGVKAGAASIVASASGFLGENSWSVKTYAAVTKAMLASLKLDVKSVTLSAAGESKIVTAVIAPEEASYPVLRWELSVVSGDAAADDVEITHIGSSRKAKITLLRYVPGAQYRLSAHTVDGSELSDDVLVNAASGQKAPSEGSGSSGGCNGGNFGWGAASLALFVLLHTSKKNRLIKGGKDNE